MFESHHHLLDMGSKTPEHEIDLIRDDDYESKSGTDNMEAASGDDQDPNDRPKKKRYHRHTQHQIQEMESYVLYLLCYKFRLNFVLLIPHFHA